MHIFLLCGLGADERLFQYLDLAPHQVTPVKWVPPLPGDSMSSYARRLLPQITSPDPVLIGVSFGGMIATEIGNLIPTRKVILISSAAKASELRTIFRIIGTLRIHRLFPGVVLKNSHRMLNWVMGANDAVRKHLLKDMLRDTDSRFLYWAIDQVVRWQNETSPDNLVTIHGDKDFVLPRNEADFMIAGGGHLIVANRATEVSGYISKVLK